MNRTMIINGKYETVFHVMPIKSIGYVFEKTDTSPEFITPKGKATFPVNGELCRIHESHIGDGRHGDAFVLIGCDWLRVNLATVVFVRTKHAGV